MQIDVEQIFVGKLFTEPSRCIKTGMKTELLAAAKHLCNEVALKLWLSTRKRDAAFADLQHVRVLADCLHRARDRHRLAITFVPGIGVVAVLTAQQAAGEKRDKAQAGA